MSKNKFRFSFVLLFSVCLAVLPFISSATLVPCNGLNCNICDLITLIKNIVNFLISLSVILGVIFIIWGGFLILTSTGSSGRLEDGKKAIGYAITGLIIVLGAWLIVDTTLRIFMGSNSPTDWGPWNTFPACERPVTPTTPINQTVPSTNYGPGGTINAPVSSPTPSSGF
jgi:hypothetical protein